jgi:hypothetical protein
MRGLAVLRGMHGQQPSAGADAAGTTGRLVVGTTEAAVPCPPGLKSTTSTRSSNIPHSKRTRTGDPDCYRILWGGDQTEVGGCDAGHCGRLLT